MASPGNEDESQASLDGLAQAWEDDSLIRTLLLHNGSLLSWPSERMQGVVTFDTMRPKAGVIKHVIRTWCPRVKVPKTLCIDQVRAQDGVEKT